MKRTSTILLSVAALVGSAGPASGGMGQGSPVTLIRGTLQYVRSSASTAEYIQCSSQLNAFTCTARTAAGVTGACSLFSTDPGFAAMLDIIRNLNEVSHISMGYNATTGKCTSLGVEIYSWNMKP